MSLTTSEFRDLVEGYLDFVEGSVSGAAAALGETVDTSAVSPFDKLSFAKSAAVDTATVTYRIGRGGKGVVIISGLSTETIAITGFVGAVESGAITVASTAGVKSAATALGNGTYFIDL